MFNVFFDCYENQINSENCYLNNVYLATTLMSHAMKPHLNVNTRFGSYNCYICPAIFTNKSDLKLHVRTQSGKYACELFIILLMTVFKMSPECSLHSKSAYHSDNVYEIDPRFPLPKKHNKYSNFEL